MKKFLCIVLSVICIFSMFSISISAADGESLAKIYIMYQPQPGYDIKYDVMPSPTIIEESGVATVTDIIPKAYGYEFSYWVDNDGNTYYPGDEIFLIEPIVLYAVSFKNHNDNSEPGMGIYSITYETQPASGVSVMYKPFISITFDTSGYATVTKDTPIAINHNFVCWKDTAGNYYYEGDKVYIDGEVVLYPVFEEKTDNLITPFRIIDCVVSILERVVGKALGIFKDINDFNADYFPPENNP